jgi:periplasmic divalent cation tolerance protein
MPDFDFSHRLLRPLRRRSSTVETVAFRPRTMKRRKRPRSDAGALARSSYPLAFYGGHPPFRHMRSARAFSLVLVTAPNVQTGRLLAKAALQKRLAACINVVPAIESHYWWQGKLEQGAEVLLLFKTPTRLLPALEKLLLAQHPYDTPEFLAISLHAGNRRYLEWLGASVQKEPTRRAPRPRPGARSKRI